MTVKELIEELKQFDENLIVVYTTTEYILEPAPSEQSFYQDSDYFTGKEFIIIPKNTKFISL